MEVFGFAVELWKWCPVLDLGLLGAGGGSGAGGSGGRFPVPDPFAAGEDGAGVGVPMDLCSLGGSGRDPPGAQS